VTRREDSGAEHDAYLRSALRHAPDAALAPPDALDHAILRRARSATADVDAGSPVSIPSPRENPRKHRPSASDSRLGRIVTGLAGAWSWLARPAVASGFAGVMVATLVGVMWWGRPLDEAMPGRYEPPAPSAPAASDRDPGAPALRSEPPLAGAPPNPSEATGAPSNAAPQRREGPGAAAPRANAEAFARSTQGADRKTAEPASPPATTQAAPDLLAKRRAAPAAVPEPSESRADAGTRERRAAPEAGSAADFAAPKAQLRAAASEPALSPSPPSEPGAMPRFEIAAPRPDPSTAPRQRAPAIGSSAPTSRETPAAAQSPAMPASREAPERLAAAPARSGITAAASPPALADRATASGDAAATADDRRAERADAARPSAGALSSGRVAPPTRSPLGPLRAALATEPDRWTWSADGRRVQRVTPALLAWLARLDAALAAQPADNRWSEQAPESDDPAPASTATGPVHTLVLLREGRRHTELRLGEALEVTPIDPPGPRWRVPLSAADAAALRQSLP